jgi:hypothetical protein
MYAMTRALILFFKKYKTIVTHSAYAFIGWFLSWVLFFIMSPFMMSYYGKLKGLSLNYAFSWVSMIGIIITFEIVSSSLPIIYQV